MAESSTQVTGQPYQSWVQKNILAPCSIATMQIGANSERHRASTEVVYIGQYSEDPYKINVSCMDSTQGWIASATQLVQFLNHVAGAPGIPANNPLYARGWMIGEDGSWSHNGSLPSFASLMVRRPDGACWGALCNTRTQPRNEMDSALYTMMSDLAHSFPG